MTRAEFDRLNRNLAPGVQAYVKKSIANAVEPLQMRIKELEARQLKYMGVFREGEKYERGQMVTSSGSLWHCEQPTMLRPPASSWTLVAKRGADGKDGKDAAR